MNIRYRNTFQKRFEGKVTVEKICTYATVLETHDWKLDISVHTDGIEIDSEGITMHFVKTSDKRETVTPDEDFLFNADTTLDLMRQHRQQKRQSELLEIEKEKEVKA